MARRKSDVELRISAKDDATKNLKKIKDRLDRIAQTQGLAKNFQQAEKELAVLDAQVRKLEKSLTRVGASKDIDKAIKANVNDVKRLETGIDRQTAALDKARSSAKQYRGQLRELSRTAEELSSKRMSISLDLEKAKRSLAALKGQVTKKVAAGVDTAAAEKKLNAQQKVVDKLQKQLGQTETQIDRNSNKIAAADAKRVRELKKMQVATKAVATAQKQLEDAKGKGGTLGAELGQAKRLEAQLAEVTAEHKAATKEVNKYGDRLGSAKGDAQQLDKAMASLTAKQERLNALQARQQHPNSGFQRFVQAEQGLGERRAAEARAAAAAVAQEEATTRRYRKELAELARQIREAGGTQAQWNEIKRRSNGNIFTAIRLTKEYTDAVRQQQQAQKSAARDAERMRKSQARAARETDRLNKQGRSSLTIWQRMRAEATGLVAAYVGIHGTLQALNAVFETQNALVAARNRFAVGFAGDQGLAGAELGFAQEAARRLGLQIQSTTAEYSKFVAASNGLGFSQMELRKIFLGVAKAVAVNKLSAADAQGVYRALTQIMSKNQVMAEELRLQLGDRLPGAVTLMAQSLNVSTAELAKMMEQGDVSARALVGFAETMDKKFSPQMAAAMDSPRAKINAFQNAMFDLRKALIEDGFLEAVTGMLEDLTDYISQPETIEGIKSFADWMVKLGQILASLIPHLDVMVKIFGTLAAGKILVSVAGGLGSVGTAMGAAGAAAKGGATAFRAAGIALRGLLPFLGPLAAAAYGAYEIYNLWTASQEENNRVLNDSGIELDSTADKVKKYREQLDKTLRLIDKANKLNLDAGATSAERIAAEQVQAAKERLDAAKEAVKILQDEELELINRLAELERKTADVTSKLENAKGTPGGNSFLGVSATQLNYDAELRAANTEASELQRRLAEVRRTLDDSRRAGQVELLEGELDASKRAARDLQLPDIQKISKDAEKAYTEVVNAAKSREDKLADLNSRGLKSTLDRLDAEAKAVRETVALQVKMRQQEQASFRARLSAQVDESDRSEVLALYDDLIEKRIQLRRLAEQGGLDPELSKQTIAQAKQIAGFSTGALSGNNLLSDIDRVVELNDQIDTMRSGLDSLGKLQPFERQNKALIAVDESLDRVSDKMETMTREDQLPFAREQFGRLRKEVERENLGDDLTLKLKVRIDRAEFDFVQDHLQVAMTELEQQLTNSAGASLEERLRIIGQSYANAIKLVRTAGGSTGVGTEAQDLAAAELENQRRLAKRNEFERELNRILEERQGKLEANQNLRLTEGRTELDAQNAAIQIDESTRTQLEELLRQSVDQLRIATENQDQGAVAYWTKVTKGIVAAANELTSFDQKQKQLAEDINRQFANGIANAFDSFVSGAASAKDAFRQFASDFLRQIAQMILQQTILNALGGGGIGGAVAGGLSSAGVFHSGGIVGSGDGGKASVPSWVYSMAPRYHNGGVAGLAPNEVPAVLEKGEEVLTRDDPRHMANAGAGAASPNVNLKAVNVFDSAGLAEELLSTPEGEKVFVNFIRRNSRSIKGALG